MEDLILIAHGLVIGSAVYLGFWLLFFMMRTLMFGDGKTEQSSFLDRCMDKRSLPVLLIALIVVPFLIFIISFVPTMLAFAFGPAYIFEVTSMFQCNGIVFSARTGVTEISTCTKTPVLIGAFVSFCGWSYFHKFRHAIFDGEPH